MKLDVDDFIRACLAIWVASRIDSCGVIETMADVTITKGVPEHIISDNDSEMTAKVVRNLFCKARSEDAVHRAWQSVGERILREPFNGKLRDECQTAESLKEAIVVIEQWHFCARNPPSGSEAADASLSCRSKISVSAFGSR
jgi:putative transposase